MTRALDYTGRRSRRCREPTCSELCRNLQRFGHRLEASTLVGKIVASMSVFIAWTLLGSLCGAAAEPATQPMHKVRIVLVGDSTVTNESGWGLGFKQRLGD